MIFLKYRNIIKTKRPLFQRDQLIERGSWVVVVVIGMVVVVVVDVVVVGGGPAEAESTVREKLTFQHVLDMHTNTRFRSNWYAS